MLDFVWFSLEYDKSLISFCREIMNCYGKEKFSNVFMEKKEKFLSQKQSESHFNSNKTGLMRSKDPLLCMMTLSLALRIQRENK